MNTGVLWGKLDEKEDFENVKRRCGNNTKMDPQK